MELNRNKKRRKEERGGHKDAIVKEKARRAAGHCAGGREQWQRVEEIHRKQEVMDTSNNAGNKKRKLVKLDWWWVNWTDDRSSCTRREWVFFYEALQTVNKTGPHTNSKTTLFSLFNFLERRSEHETSRRKWAWHFTAASLRYAFSFSEVTQPSVTTWVLTRPPPPKSKASQSQGTSGRWHHPASLILRDPSDPHCLRDCAQLTYGPPRVNDEKEINMAVFQRPAEP